MFTDALLLTPKSMLRLGLEKLCPEHLQVTGVATGLLGVWLPYLATIGTIWQLQESFCHCAGVGSQPHLPWQQGCCRQEVDVSWGCHQGRRALLVRQSWQALSL